VIVCDTGPLVAAAITDDTHHRACVDLFAALHLAGRQILVPATVAAEVGYLLAREGRALVESQFLASLADGTLQPVDLTREDYRRAAQLVLEYASLPLGTTDATVIAVTERLGLTEVATLDRRHFTVVRPLHVPTLTLVPE
jgi:predicted nucleic acid-binding protein